MYADGTIIGPTTVYDNEGVAWTYNPALNEDGYPTLTGDGMTIEVTDPEVSARLVELFVGTIVTDPVANNLQTAAQAYVDSSQTCGGKDCARQVRSRVLHLRWKLAGRDWEPPMGWTPPPPPPWEPPRHPGPSAWSEPEDFPLLASAFLMQSGWTCSDIADAGLIANAQYHDSKFNVFKTIFYDGIKSFAKYVAYDVLHNHFGLGAGWTFSAPGNIASVVVADAEYQAYNYYVGRANIDFVTIMWNDYGCGSQQVRAGVTVVPGNPLPVGGTVALSCMYELFPLELSNGTYWVEAMVCNAT